MTGEMVSSLQNSCSPSMAEVDNHVGSSGAPIPGWSKRCGLASTNDRTEAPTPAYHPASMLPVQTRETAPDSPQENLRLTDQAMRGATGTAGTEALCSARSNASVESDMSITEKEGEKLRLQRLLKDFAKEAVAGITVNMVNFMTGTTSPYFFQMDRNLTVFSLLPKDGATAESSVEDFDMKDVLSIYKGRQVSIKAPCLGNEAASCVAIDTKRADRRIIFHFGDSYERDRFHTCLHILRMSIDIQRST